MVEDLIKCECCDELYTRTNYSAHWRSRAQWRDIPLWCLYDLHWANSFKQAGYRTIGDVYDATPETLAKNVFGVGPKRAVKLRQIAVDHVHRRAGQPGETVEYDPREDEPTPTLRDAVLTIGSLITICALLALTVWWLS